MLPRPSVWLLRLALVYLVAGFGAGALALASGTGAYRAALVAAHVELVLFGFAMQFTMGIAFSAFPRVSGSRGRPGRIWVALLLLNGGVLISTSAFLIALSDPALAPPALFAAGSTCVMASAVVWCADMWPRVRSHARGG
jgi:hypothetical protein